MSSQVSAEQVLEALRGVRFPGFERDIVSLDIVRGLEVDEGRVRFEIALARTDPSVARRIEAEARSAVASLEGVRDLKIVHRSAAVAAGADSLRIVNSKPSPARGGSVDPGLIPEVRFPIAVASGKGGVGKSTVAVNLAVALARSGAAVGLLDADIYGPSIPLMMGMSDAKPGLDPEGAGLLPLESHGVRFMSLGFLVDREAAVIWRGPMVMKAIEQLLRDVSWGALDYLVVDLPPGTGDAQLTLSQRVRLAGAVIVTTPQDVALADAVKGVAMFRKVGVEVLGLVENMSFFQCPQCDARTEIFAHGGGRRHAERMGVPFLGEVPLHAAIRLSGDTGKPVVAEEPDSPHAVAFADIAGRLREALEQPGG